MTSAPKILIVDDEEHIRKILTIMLSKKGYQTQSAPNGQAALDLIRKEAFDAVITDLRMSGMDGLELLKRLKDYDPDLIVLVITAFSSIDTAVQAIRQGAFDYLSKPFKEEEILLVLEKALERQRILAENKRLKAEVREKYDFSYFIGESSVMRRVFDIIAKVAETKSTVLITGESGAGKELAARAIHLNSPRKDKPFVPVNCGAVPANLLESEFFGHVRGAFSGADRNKKGLFEEADGGTLFLDEISELPLDMQVKLLRAIQEEEIRRLGESTTRTVDLRLIAAANKDLLEEVKAGRFREDLYYRLKVIVLKLPPLRERPEDIPLLTQHFLNQMVKKHGLEQKRISPEAVRILTAQTWSGNVRALRNVIEQAVVMSEGPTITPRDLPFGPPTTPDVALQALIPDEGMDLKAILREVVGKTEKVIIARTLGKFDKNRTRAAEALGISRRALITKIKEYNLE
ncbi:MAG: sigma-54 dependent transcriptional regulator [Pseudomonadota bacterium]